MKKGFLFFLNMGRITTIARISIIPLFLCVINIPFHSILYTLSCILFALSILLSMIPAPSDRTAEKVINEFELDLRQRLLNCCRVKDGNAVILKGYEKVGLMVLRRGLGKEVIYPHLVAIGFLQTMDKTVLIVAKKTMLSAAPVEYQEIECVQDTRFLIQSKPIDEEESIAEVTFSVENAQQAILMYAKMDYHYRDLLGAIKPFMRI